MALEVKPWRIKPRRYSRAADEGDKFVLVIAAEVLAVRDDRGNSHRPAD
jgi:hypothetical protein